MRLENNSRKFFPFSKKQLTALSWWSKASTYYEYDAIICDGAVRSGKTSCMSVGFVAWAFYQFNSRSFAICGKTVASLRRNVITELLPILESLGFSCKLKVSSNIVVITKNGRENRFYLFGGKDEASASLIQGMTLAGVLFDEVALMPRSFVEQALARCSVEGSRFWFNCNPENPQHWFYLEWIKKAQEKNALYVHFRMEDNPSLSPEILARYKSLYSGHFYERFVLGKWVAAQGLVYSGFDIDKDIASPPDYNAERYFISCDYGTVNPSSFGLWGLYDGIWYRVREYYYNSRKTGSQRTDEEHYAALCELAQDCKISAVIVDPSAASFIECIRRHGKFSVTPAKNNVVDGIRRVSDALRSGEIKIAPCCKDAIREFGLYRWDDNLSKDAPRKENDHAMDDIRYFVMGVIAQSDCDFFALALER